MLKMAGDRWQPHNGPVAADTALFGGGLYVWSGRSPVALSGVGWWWSVNLAALVIDEVVVVVVLVKGAFLGCARVLWWWEHGC